MKRHDFDKDVNILDQPAHGACTMIRTKFLKELGGYDESYTCQDGYELWVKFINKFNVSNISETLFSYRRHNNNLTNNENKILSTRSKIKDAYVKKNKLILPRTAAIIPLRPDHDIPFENFGNTTFLDHKIEELLSAENIVKVIVTSSNILVKKYIVNKYNKRVTFIQRPEALERINVSLYETLIFLSEQPNPHNIEAYLFCSVSYPFVDRKSINDSVNTLSIFKADSLISVRPEGNKFYRHTGAGMKAILEQDSFTKLERESLYMYTGGLILSMINSAKKANKLIHGNVGHIVVSEIASLNVESSFEKEICK
jgi:CMP-N-acetylneuraminic acid synthetase